MVAAAGAGPGRLRATRHDNATIDRWHRGRGRERLTADVPDATSPDHPAGDADVSPARMVGDLLTSLEPVLPGVTKAYAGRAGHDSGLLDPLCGH